MSDAVPTHTGKGGEDTCRRECKFVYKKTLKTYIYCDILIFKNCCGVVIDVTCKIRTKVMYYFVQYNYNLQSCYIGPSGVQLGCSHKRSGHSTWHYFSFFFFPCPLLFYQKGGRYGFAILHGLLTNKNKNSERKNKIRTPPDGPLGGDF